MGNVERTFDRNDLSLSIACRRDKGLRHLDIDMIQYCDECKDVQIVMEATSQKSGKPTTMVTAIANRISSAQTTPCMSVLIIHEDHDHENENPVAFKILNNGGVKYKTPGGQSLLLRGTEYNDAPWSRFQDFLKYVHNEHRKICPKC